MLADRLLALRSFDDIIVDDQAATPIALVFHELATNAAKYVALSNENGRVIIHSRMSGQSVIVDWLEQGGPAVTGAPSRSGFGTQLAEMSIERQLGGRIEREWHRSGLALSLILPLDRLTRTGPAPA